MRSNGKKNTKNFRLIFYGTMVSFLGTTIYDYAILWWLVQVTGTTLYSGYTMAAVMLGNILFGPIAGVLTDKLNKKSIIVVSDFFSGLVCLSVGLIIHFNIFNIIFLVISSFLMGISQSAFSPTSRAIIPEIIEKDSLLKVNSFITNSNSIIKIIGPLVGTILVSIDFIGVSGAIILNGFSFIVSALFELFIDYRKSNSDNIKSLSGIKEDIIFGFKYIVGEKLIFIVVLSATIANFFLASFNILIPTYINNMTNTSNLAYSSVLASEAIGAILLSGIIIGKKKIKTNIHNIFISLIGMGIILFFTSFAKNTYHLLALALMLGILMTLFNLQFITYLQTVVNKKFTGRVFSTIFTLVTLFLPVAYLLYGYLGQYSISLTFMTVGCLMIGFFMYIYKFIILKNKITYKIDTDM